MGTSPLLFLFLDGVGLGSEDGRVNPFVAARTPFLEGMLGGPLTAALEQRDGPAVLRHLDATLGHAGLPQSATGQATLLTGENGAATMGGHYGPWPGPTLRAQLDAGTLFSEVLAAGGTARFANAYPPGYFDAIAAGRTRTNVPVHAALSAGLRLPDLEDYRRREAVTSDLSGEYFASLDTRLEPLLPRESGARLGRISQTTTFTFFDFWLSDRVGHRGSMVEAVELVERLDEFLAGVVNDLGDTTLLVVSDHGNLEDKSTRGHTRAPVPLLALGPLAGGFASCGSLLDVAPAVRTVLDLVSTAANGRTKG